MPTCANVRVRVRSLARACEVLNSRVRDADVYRRPGSLSVGGGGRDVAVLVAATASPFVALVCQVLKGAGGGEKLQIP